MATDDEITLMARAKASDQKAFEYNLLKFKALVWVLSILTTGLVAATIWVTVIRSDVTTLKDDVKALKLSTASDTATIRAMLSTQVDANKIAAEGLSGRITTGENSLKLWQQSIMATVDGNKQERLNEISSLRSDIGELKPLVPKVDEMWFMKQHGISNAQDYISNHPGQGSPPLNSASDGTMKPPVTKK